MGDVKIALFSCASVINPRATPTVPCLVFRDVCVTCPPPLPGSKQSVHLIWWRAEKYRGRDRERILHRRASAILRQPS